MGPCPLVPLPPSPRPGSEPLDGVAALDPGGGTSPFTARDSVLVGSECRSIAEQFVNLPHQRVVGGGHAERDAANFGTCQRDVAGEMLDDDGNLVVIAAHEYSTETNISHRAIFPHHKWTLQRNSPVTRLPISPAKDGPNVNDGLKWTP